MAKIVGMPEARSLLLKAFRAGIDAADPRHAVENALAERDDAWGSIFVIAFGKAACAMTEGALNRIPREKLAAAPIVVTNDENHRDLPGCRVFAASHPLPDARGMAAAQEIMTLLDGTRSDDLVLVLVSGGGSALLPLPAPGITLEEKIRTTDLLLASGADINQMNAVRKHLSAIKGGQLAQKASPASLQALILSDVIGDDLSVIASGPTVPDPSTFADCRRILESYGIWDDIPASARHRIAEGCAGNLPETPKPGDETAANTLIGSNAMSLQALEDTLRTAGLSVEQYSGMLTGEAREEAGRLVTHIKKRLEENGHRSFAVTAGGETTVTLSGGGLGGRNQEFTLAFAIEAEKQGLDCRWTCLSGGTDGRDGPTDAAGGLVDGDTLSRLRHAGTDPTVSLQNNDAYHALEKSGDLIRIGGTGTNVADLVGVVVLA